jgi:hypothetical protein
MLTYILCQHLFAKCRFPTRGKPVRSVHTGARLFFNDTTKVFTLSVYNQAEATISPDNVVHLLQMPNNQTTTHVYRYAFGVHHRRIKRNMYRVSARTWAGSTDPYWHPEMRVDMNNRTFVNALPDPVRKNDADKSLEWKRVLRKYNRLWDMAVKFGAAEHVYTLCKEHQQAWHNGNHAAHSQLYRAITPSQLIAYMRNCDVSTEAMLHIAISTGNGYIYRYSHGGLRPVEEHLRDALSRVYNALRDEVRREVGCFEE